MSGGSVNVGIEDRKLQKTKCKPLFEQFAIKLLFFEFSCYFNFSYDMVIKLFQFLYTRAIDKIIKGMPVTIVTIIVRTSQRELNRRQNANRRKNNPDNFRDIKSHIFFMNKLVISNNWPGKFAIAA
jgi:hypothetical protein